MPGGLTSQPASARDRLLVSAQILAALELLLEGQHVWLPMLGCAGPPIIPPHLPGPWPPQQAPHCVEPMLPGHAFTLDQSPVASFYPAYRTVDQHIIITQVVPDGHREWTVRGQDPGHELLLPVTGDGLVLNAVLPQPQWLCLVAVCAQ